MAWIAPNFRSPCASPHQHPSSLVNKTLPNYLRVHRGPDRQNNADSVSTKIATGKTAPGKIDVMAEFWNQFSHATGWRVDRRSLRPGQPVVVLPVVGDVDMGSVQQCDDMVHSDHADALHELLHEQLQVDAASPLPMPHVAGIAGSSNRRSPSPSVAPESAVGSQNVRSGLGKADATMLAEAARAIADQLDQSRQTLRHQSAELAARASVITGDATPARVADAIEGLMSDAVMATGCTAAVMYLLDDDTQYLHARAAFGMSPSVLAKPARLLRGSRGDLEAMVRDVVMIDDLNATLIDTWNSPEPFAAAICVVIKSADLPIGTLWLFADEVTAFDQASAAAARLVAAAIASQLSAATARRGAAADGDAKQTVAEIGVWQHETMPVGANLAPDWKVDGMIESPRNFATGFHTWDVLPDGCLMLSIAEAVDRSIAGAMSATVARSALASHSNYRHDPAGLLCRVSDTLWQTSTGEQLVSMLYALIDPETGEGEIASAGHLTAIIGNRYGYRPLIDGHGQPLNTHIDARPVTRTFRMLDGETLLACTAGMIQSAAKMNASGGVNWLGQQIAVAMRAGDANPLAAIRRSMASAKLSAERGAVSLYRR